MRGVSSDQRFKRVHSTEWKALPVRSLMAEINEYTHAHGNQTAELAGCDYFPIVLNHDTKCKMRLSRIEFNSDVRLSSDLIEVKKDQATLLEILLPDGESVLAWSFLGQFLPPSEEDSAICASTRKHSLNGGTRTMARMTACYQIPYSFSGQTHPIETTTPDYVLELIENTNRVMCVPNKTFSMCFVNYYANGHAGVTKHADNMDQARQGYKDVVCWVTGEAARTFRIHSNLPPTDLVLELILPRGMYAMIGPDFQKRYTHEIPKEHTTLIERIIKHDETLWKPPNVRAEDVSHEQKITAIADKPQQVEALILSGKLWTRKMTMPQLAAYVGEYKDWCLSRTSYTIRAFEWPLSPPQSLDKEPETKKLKV